jgi:hypothetical protein
MKSKGIKRRIQIVKNITPQQTEAFDQQLPKGAKE